MQITPHASLSPAYLLERVQFDPFGGCWLWALSCGSHGYGQIVFQQVHELAHRASWMVHRGPIPEGMMVLHRCDVRPCIRPDHLFLGDELANQHDAMLKGRSVNPPILRGTANPSTKLTPAQVLEARAQWGRRAATQEQLAARYGVALSTIWAAIHEHTHVSSSVGRARRS